jgi:DNA replication protein DnaC
VNLRYEKERTVLTTNLAFSDWPTLFPNATCTTALIDRGLSRAMARCVCGTRASDVRFTSDELAELTTPGA